MTSIALGLALCLANTTAAQVPGSPFTMAPILGLSNGTASVFMSTLNPTPIDNAYSAIGLPLVGGSSLFGGDLKTPLGGDNYRLELSIVGPVGYNLVHAGYPVTGTPSTHFGMAIGHIINGFPIEIDGGEALFVSSAEFFTYDQAGNVISGPHDVSQNLNLYDQDYGGGWDGNAAFLVPQTAVTGSVVEKLQLVIEYRVGQPNDFQTWFNSGCTPVPWASTPYLELASAAVIGQPMRLEANNVPSPTLGLWLLLGAPTSNQISLGILGGDPNCMSWITSLSTAPFMPIDTTGVADHALTFTVPFNPALVGAEFGMQPLGIYGAPMPPFNGFYVGTYSEVTIGG